jgi:hypothetical protein
LSDTAERMEVYWDSISVIIHFEKAHDSVKREVLYNILTKFGVPMKLVKLMRMCLYETYGKVCTSKSLSDVFPLHNGLLPTDVHCHCS